MTALIRLGGYGAITGGTLKLIAAFIPYTPQSAGLALLYGAIDAGLLLGLITVYLVAAEQIVTPHSITYNPGAASIAGYALLPIALGAATSVPERAWSHSIQ